MICSSVHQLFFIVDLLSIDSTIRWRELLGVGRVTAERAKSSPKRG
jgi:hypothetical protein